MNKKRIAIIGGGAAGTVAAWQLSSQYEVVLFEASSHLGGHAYSHKLKDSDNEYNIDMAVEYFNERLCPNVCALLEKFGIDSYVAPLTMHAEFADGQEYWSNHDTEGELSQKLRKEFDRFHFDMANAVSSGDERFKAMSIGQFLEENDYSDDFKYKALLPMLTVYSGCDAPSLEYNFMYVAISFNLNLLSFFSAGYWRKAKGGIQAYIHQLAELLGDKVKLNTPIERLTLEGDTKVLHFGQNQKASFNEVVFATHADITLKILGELDPIYQQKLGEFEYVPVRSYAHKDSSVLANTAGKSYCQFKMTDLDYRNSYGSLTRVNQYLAPYENASRPLFVTFDPKTEIDANSVDCVKDFKLPKLRPMDFYRKTQLKAIQGKYGIWFCGTDTSLTGHEGAIVSAFVICDRLGVNYPFADNAMAKIQFKVIKEIMGVYKKDERLSNWFSNLIFKISKGLSLHKEQSHKYIKDLMV